MNEVAPPVGEFALPNHPGVPDGLLAYAQPSRHDGTFDHDRSGRPKVRRVHLRADPPVSPERPADLLNDADWKWATRAPRKWSTITSRLDERANEIALTLARTGCVALDHGYQAGNVQHPPRRWIPHPHLAAQHAASTETRQVSQQALMERAEELRDRLADEWPGAAEALGATAAETRLTWFIRAAEDLLAGRSHDGPRAFVQHHAKNTKAREDLTRLLADSGFEPEALAILGVNRNPYIGVGGPIRAFYDGRILDWTDWPGPHDIRLPADRPINLDVASVAKVLLVIENRQAAEAICDSHPDTAVIWCHGQPPDSVLRLINQVAQAVHRVVICPDADLGGIHIAARVNDNLPPDTLREVVDIGKVEHDQGPPFSATTRERVLAMSLRQDSVGKLAHGCRARGYAVEQEAPARAALRGVL